MKKLMNRWTGLFLVALAVIVGVGLMTQTDHAKEPDRVYVDGKLMEGDAFSSVNYNDRFKTVYIPMVEVGKAVGLGVTKIDQNTLEVVTKDNDRHLMTNGGSTIMHGENFSKFKPYAFETLNGIKVPLQKGPYLQNGHFMTPHETLRDVFGYPVEVKKRTDGGYDVIIGKQPVEEPKEEPVTPPVAPPVTGDIKENPLYPFPTGWAAKSIGDKRVTGNVEKDLQTIGTTLGFHPEDIRKTVAYFDPDNQLNYTLMFGRESFEEFEVKIIVRDLTYDKNGSDLNKTAYILPEVLKFYEVPGVYKTVEAGMIRNDRSGYEKKTVINGREVEMWMNSGETIIMVGKKGKSYDDSWNMK